MGKDVSRKLGKFMQEGGAGAWLFAEIVESRNGKHNPVAGNELVILTHQNDSGDPATHGDVAFKDVSVIPRCGLVVTSSVQRTSRREY